MSSSHHTLSRRERQIMDVLYQRGKATALEVQESLPDPPSYSAVRALLRILEDKGHVRHEQDGPRYVFTPKTPRDKARRSAIRHVMETFFEDSPEQAVAALLDVSSAKLTEEELDRLAQLIENARLEGKK
jgi:predicted transcriptional regulator